MSFSILSKGLQNVERYFNALPDIAEKAASLAINDVAERTALPLARQDILGQVAFPADYLKRPDRLGISKKASPKSLSAKITARDRPTSLARFAPAQTPQNTRKTGVRIEVKKGSRKVLKRAFLVNLKNGNIGLAVRLKEGEKIDNKRDEAARLAPNVYLLYGPSIDQVFRDTAQDIEPQITSQLTKQFLRQFARLTNG